MARIAELSAMRAIVWIFLCCLPVHVGAQTDSLIRVLNALPNDTSRLPVLTDLLRATVFNKPDSALVFAAQYRTIAARSGISLEIGKGHNYTGMCYSFKSEHDRALEHYLAALPHFENGGDQWYVGMAHNNIGSVHEKMRRMDKAREEYGTALGIFKAIPDTVWMANVSNNLGNLHFAEARWDSATVYYTQADRVLTIAGMDSFSGQTRMNLANALYEQGEHARALEVMRNALAVMPQGEDDRACSSVLTALGRLHGLVGREDSALYFLHAGLTLAEQVGAREDALNAHLYLFELHEQHDRPDQALFHHKRMAALRDSIFDEERSAQITEMQEKYESGLKDARLAENEAQLERRSMAVKAFAGGALLLLVAGLFAFRAYRLKKRSSEQLAAKNAIIDAQLKEKELLVREIHHRVKNNLQTVSSLLSIQGRGIADEAAKEAVNDSRLRVKSMALIHQDLYREGDLTGVRMKDYVEKLVNSLITSYAASEHITAAFEVDDVTLDVDTAVPIGLVLYELATNALKYAWPEGHTGALVIRLKHHTDALELTVTDDGVGKQDTMGDERSSGFGMNMVRTFANKLKAEHSAEHVNGTTVRMLIRNFKLAR